MLEQCDCPCLGILIKISVYLVGGRTGKTKTMLKIAAVIWRLPRAVSSPILTFVEPNERQPNHRMRYAKKKICKEPLLPSYGVSNYTKETEMGLMPKCSAGDAVLKWHFCRLVDFRRVSVYPR